jgi:hypothetical protein
MCGEDNSDFFIKKIEAFPETEPICGDVNADGVIDMDDVYYLNDYMFNGGPPPSPLETGDVDCIPGIEMSDLIRLIDFVLYGSPALCDC